MTRFRSLQQRKKSIVGIAAHNCQSRFEVIRFYYVTY